MTEHEQAQAEADLRCSFCDKSRREVGSLVTRDDRPGISICNECVSVSVQRLLITWRRPKPPPSKPA